MAQSKTNQTHHTFCATTSATGKFVSSLDQALMNAHRGKTSYANTTSRMCTSLAWWRVVCRLDAHLNMDENRGIRRVRFMGLGCRHTWRIMSFIAIHRNCSYCTLCTPVVRHDHGISWLFSVSRICTCVHEHIKWETVEIPSLEHESAYQLSQVSSFWGLSSPYLAMSLWLHGTGSASVILPCLLLSWFTLHAGKVKRHSREAAVLAFWVIQRNIARVC